MLMNYEKMNEIVASLPISFYTRTRYDIFVELDKTSENTYLEICEDHFNIHISYPVLSQYGADLTERQIRSLFYHEISHILDESKYVQFAGFDELTEEEKQSAYNIIADERIETIYKDYYTGVDFDKTKRELIKIKESDYFLDHFLWLVRLGYNASLYSNFVHNDIKTAIADNYSESAVIALNTFRKEFDRLKVDEKITVNNKRIINGGWIPEYDSNRYSEEDWWWLEDCKSEAYRNANRFQEKTNWLRSSFKSLDENFQTYFNKNKNKFNSTCSYSGVFNNRAVVNDDYRWWTSINRNGQYKKHNKLHLRFVIDNSGSFDAADEVNVIINSLNLLEKKYPMFSYSFSTINTNFVVWSHDDQNAFSAVGGNKLFMHKNEILKFLNDMCVGDAEYYNIVLFDGDAYTDEYLDLQEEIEGFEIFDRFDTSLIIESSNLRYCKNFKTGKVIVENYDYAEKLIENIEDTIVKFLNV